MATYRVRLKRPVWDDIETAPFSIPFTDYTSVGGSPVKLSDSARPINQALMVVAYITNKTISINDLSVIGETAISGTIYAIQNGPTLYSPNLCFSYNGTLYIIKLQIDGCGE